MTKERIESLKIYVSAAAYALEGALNAAGGDVEGAEQDYLDTIKALDMLKTELCVHTKKYDKVLLTSLPPKQRWVCTKCGATGIDTIAPAPDCQEGVCPL